MFTLHQINEIHERLGNQASLPQYLQALQAIGVNTYDSFLEDGHSAYFGKENQKTVSPPVHEKLAIAQTSSKEGLLHYLKLHSEGKIDYSEMSKGLASSGIKKWTFDTHQMSITYYDLDEKEMLVEAIN